MNGKRSFTIHDFVLALVKRKTLIVGTTLLAMFITVAAMRLSTTLAPDHDWNYFPDTFQPGVKVMVTWMGMAVMQESLGISRRSLGAFALVGANPFFAMIDQLIRGNTILDQISEEFDLYDTVSPTKGGTRGWLLQRIVTLPLTQTPLPTFSFISIGFRHTDKIMAYRIVNRMIELLHEKFDAMTSENLRAKKRYLELSISDTEHEIERYKEDLKRFQREYGVFDIDRQASQQANLLAQKMVELLKKELELRSVQRYFGIDSPRSRMLRGQIDTINRFITELQTESIGGLIPLEKIPDLKDQYTVISQNLKIKLSIYEKLRKEYEKLRLSEISSLENIQIVEQAEIPEGPVFPNRLMILLTIIITTFFEVVIWALFKEYLERLKERPGEADKVREIKTMLKRL